MRRAFVLPFWIGTAAALAALFLPLFLRWEPARHRMDSASRLFPVAADEYLSETSGGQLAHVFYRYGFFGIGERLRRADVVLAGTSHAEWGMSAKILAERLSAAAGRPVSVYNLGMGCVEGWGFIEEVIEGNRLRHQVVCIDLHCLLGDGRSPWGEEVDRKGRIGGLIAIGNMWTAYLKDALLDRYAPRVSLAPASFLEFRRALGYCAFRSWKTGDVTYEWAPAGARYFAPSPVPYVSMEERAGAPEAGGIMLPPLALRLLAGNDLRPVLMLVPYVGADFTRAREVADALRDPYIPLSPAGMYSFDGGRHLNADSRDQATERLAAEWRKRAYPPLAPVPGP